MARGVEPRGAALAAAAAAAAAVKSLRESSSAFERFTHSKTAVAIAGMCQRLPHRGLSFAAAATVEYQAGTSLPLSVLSTLECAAPPWSGLFSMEEMRQPGSCSKIKLYTKFSLIRISLKLRHD